MYKTILLLLAILHYPNILANEPVFENKALKFFLECVAMTGDDALCFEDAKVELLNFIETTVDKTTTDCRSMNRKSFILQKAMVQQRVNILAAANAERDAKKIGLSNCLSEKANRLTRVQSLLAERIKFTLNETQKEACKETSAYYSLLGIHAQVIGKDARGCYTSAMPKSIESNK